MKWVAVVIVAMLGAGTGAFAEAPNFLFVFIDDQGWSDTSVPMVPGNESSRNPSYRMPNLDRLAARGVIFSQAYAAHPKCECSRAALQMGRSTTSLNATDKWSRQWNAPPRDSLVNTLKRANHQYRAAHFGKWQWPLPPDEFGFDASDGVTQNEDGDSSDPMDPKQTFGITRRAGAFMEEQAREGHPFFVQLSYYATHSRPQALEETLRKYQGSAFGDPGSGRGARGAAIMAAMSEDLDTCIGSLFRKLNELGIAKNTYIIYMSDNGMGGSLLKGGKAECDEGGLRVPLIVAGPGVRTGVYCDVPVVSYDLFPTVLDLAAPGFGLPAGVEGGVGKPCSSIPVQKCGVPSTEWSGITMLKWIIPRQRCGRVISNWFTIGTRRRFFSMISRGIWVRRGISCKQDRTWLPRCWRS